MYNTTQKMRSQARDISLMKVDYTNESVQPVDVFPLKTSRFRLEILMNTCWACPQYRLPPLGVGCSPVASPREKRGEGCRYAPSRYWALTTPALIPCLVLLPILAIQCSTSCGADLVLKSGYVFGVIRWVTR